MRRRALALAGMLGALLALAPLGGCQKKLEASQFVGKWQSSRLSTPLVMRDNGDWEIRTEDDAVRQYGVWQLDGQRLIWSIRSPDGAVTRDVTTVVSVEPRLFVLRERDASTTRFVRLD